MSAEYAILWPALVEGGPSLLVVKVLSRSPIAFVREHWRNYDADGMFVHTEHDVAIELGAYVRFCVIGMGGLRLIEGHGRVAAIRRAAGGVPGLRVTFNRLEPGSETLHQAMLQHAWHVERVGTESLPAIPPPLPGPEREGGARAVGEIYRVRQRPAPPPRKRHPALALGRGEFEEVETRSSIRPLDDDALSRN